MSTYTEYVTLDSIIRTRCRQDRDDYMHRWGEIYSLSKEALLELELSKFPVKGMQYWKVPLTDGRAFIPEGVSGVTGVGIEVGGHIQWLKFDANMLDLPGDCGGYATTQPWNPDSPSIRTDGWAPTLYTGGVNGWFGTDLYYPGMNRNKSVHGYWKSFPHNGYVLVDQHSARVYTHLVFECLVPAFQSNTINWVPKICTQYITSYVRAMMVKFESDNNTSKRPIVRSSANDWYIEKMKLNNRQCSPPPADLWSALCLWG